MFLSALRLFKSLSGYHYRTIILTMLLPVIGPPMIAYFGPDRLVFQVILYFGAFLIWSVFAVIAVASMLGRDRSEAEHLVAQQVEGLSGQISRLEQGQEDLSADVRQRFKDLEETVRTTLKEELNVVLPPPPISVRARGVVGSFSVSGATVTVSGGGKVARFRHWTRRKCRRLWEVVYGKPEEK